MKGQYTIDVQNRSAHFKLTLTRNITILKGDSATGKSTLVRMIREYAQNGEHSGISLSCDRKCYVADEDNWKSQVEHEDSIIFIDEGTNFVKEIDFGKVIQESSNYYVIVSRERLPYLSYSVDEVYGLKNKTKTKYKNYTVFHTQQNKIYTSHLPGKIPLPECVIVEDSNAGYQFFSSIFEELKVLCYTANGNANVFKTISERKENSILVIADGAAFGQEIERVKYLQKRKSLTLYLPESFEWLILKSRLFNKGHVKEVLEAPYEYIESKEYYTWERFFTELLVQESQSIYYLQYKKSGLNETYLDDKNRQAILDVMPEIIEET